MFISSSLDSDCAGKSDGYHIKDSGTCQNYIKCRQGAKESDATCPGTQLAHIKADGTVQCRNHKLSTSCKNYLKCTATTVSELTCPSGQYYDEATRTCVASTVVGQTTTLPLGCRRKFINKVIHSRTEKMDNIIMVDNSYVQNMFSSVFENKGNH